MRRTERTSQPRARSRQTAQVRTRTPAALALVLAIALGGAPSRATADASVRPANIRGFSALPSNSEPYAACRPPAPGRAQCLAIIDPPSVIPAADAGAAPQAGSWPAGTATRCSEATFSGEDEFCGGGAEHGFTPQDLESAYRLPSSSAGEGNTIGIVDAYGDPNAQSDLNIYRATYDLAPCEAGCFTKVNQGGGTTYPVAESEWAEETSLDLDMASAACPKCHILLVEAENELPENLGAGENEAVKLGATVISNSYAFSEIELRNEFSETAVKRWGNEYYTHAHIPLLVASGDHGYDNERNHTTNEKGECPDCSPSFPAGLASVIAVGGTGLHPEGEVGRGWGESVWALSGSGCALIATKEPWQGEKGCAKRTDNDIAAVASTETPVSVYDSYGTGGLEPPGWQDLGGTSAAAPLAAGALALESTPLIQEGAEGIYKHSANWYDVTSGTNWYLRECGEPLLCNAGIGYDGPTGVGAPDGGATATPPSAFTENPTQVTTTTATLNALVNPEASETTYYFQYGPTSEYGSTAPVSPAKVKGYSTPAGVAQSISALKSAGEYHYRVVAQSAGGITYGRDRVLWTAPKLYRSQIGTKGSERGQFEAPQYTAVNVEGDVWVSDSKHDRVEEFSATGEFVRSCGEKGAGAGQFEDPTALTASGAFLYVADVGNHRVVKIRQNGSAACEYQNSYGQGELTNPGGIAFTAEGSVLLVANAGANDIAEFDATKINPKIEATFGTKGSGEDQFVAPTDIVFGGIEAVTGILPAFYLQIFYVVDSGNNRVQRFTIEVHSYKGESPRVGWKLDNAFGTSGSGEGQLASPTAAAVDPSSGDVYVSDTANKRIETFLPSGAYVATFGKAGSGGEGFEGPTGLAIDDAGDVYVADPTNNRVSVWSNPEWHAERAPRGPHEEEREDEGALYGASCGAENDCEEVGDYKTEVNKGLPRPLAEARKNGYEWSLQPVPLPSGSQGELAAVSCVASDLCTAVGSYGQTTALSESWNGSEWTAHEAAFPTGAKASYLAGVSCTSAISCTAVGTYKNGSGQEAALAESWNGSHWTTQTLAKLPAETLASHLNSISCASAALCVAVGYSIMREAGLEVRHVLAERWNGGEWVSSLTAPEGLLWGVSCPSEKECMAVGEGAGKVTGAIGEQWNGTGWSEQAMAQSEAGTDALYGVSCASPSSCLAVGRISTTTTNEPYGEQWNGTSWRPQSAAAPEGAEHAGLYGVWCPTGTTCLAGGYSYVDELGRSAPAALAEVEGREEAPVPRLPSATTQTASPVEASRATLNGEVDPEGRATKVHFEYGTSTSYGSTTAEVSAGEGLGDVPQATTISGLVAGTTYHYRIVAASSAGTSYGSDVAFTTDPPAFNPAKGTSAFPISLTASGGETTWHVEGLAIKCTGETASGKLTGGKEGRLTEKLTGCKAGGKECGNVKEGQIETKELKVALAYTYPERNGAEGREAGFVLSPASGEVLAEFTCPTLKTTFSVKGSVIAVVTPLQVRTKTLTLTIKQTNYVQEPSAYEGEGGGKVSASETCLINGIAAKKCSEEQGAAKVTLTSEEGSIEE